MSISSTFAAIKLGLHNVLAAAGEEQPSHELGADHLSDAQSAPAIIWVPLGAPTIDLIGGGHRSANVTRLATTPGAPASAQGRIDQPNQIASRKETIDIHVWGKTFEDTEVLLNHLVAVMRVAITAGFHPISTDWTVGQDQRSKGMNICIFKCSIGIPFMFEPQPVAEYPLTLDVTGQIVSNLPRS